tara:strand:+ start:259 stop:495 length:237 start_codon:yes stop_codon:yes gene_type:complete
MKVKHAQTKTTIELTSNELHDWLKRTKEIDWMLDSIREMNDIYLSDVSKLESIKNRMVDLFGLTWDRDEGYVIEGKNT